MSYLATFNTAYLKSLDVIHQSFKGDEIWNECLQHETPEETQITGETHGVIWTKRIQYIEQALNVDPKTREFYQEFETDCGSLFVDILNSNDSILTNDSIQYLKNLNFSSLWARMDQPEQEIIWNHLKSLRQCCCMVRACECTNLDLDAMANYCAEKNQGKSLQECQTGLIQDMLSGGEMSSSIFQTLQDPSTVNSLVTNVADMLDGVAGVNSDMKTLIQEMRTMDTNDIQQEISEMFNPNNDDMKHISEVLCNVIKTGGLDEIIHNVQNSQNTPGGILGFMSNQLLQKSFDLSSFSNALASLQL